MILIGAAAVSLAPAVTRALASLRHLQLGHHAGPLLRGRPRRFPIAVTVEGSDLSVRWLSDLTHQAYTTCAAGSGTLWCLAPVDIRRYAPRAAPEGTTLQRPSSENASAASSDIHPAGAPLRSAEAPPATTLTDVLVAAHRRLRTVSQVHGPEAFDADGALQRTVVAASRSVPMLPATGEMAPTHLAQLHTSRSRPGTFALKGVVGAYHLPQLPIHLLPWMLAGQVLQIGAHTGLGQGRILWTDSTDTPLPD